MVLLLNKPSPTTKNIGDAKSKDDFFVPNINPYGRVLTVGVTGENTIVTIEYYFLRLVL
mgnify:CR=1 FL=1